MTATLIYALVTLVLAWVGIRRLRAQLADEKREHLATLRAAMLDKAALAIEIHTLRAANRELAGVEPRDAIPGRVYVRH